MPGHRISDFVGRSLLDGMRRLNARHPWSHNDHFHSWILANLPEPCRSVLDVGCGRGELLAALAPHVGRVVGADVDAAMREQSAARCTGLANVALTDLPWNEVDGPFDAVTMVAVLHHLPVEEALRDVRRKSGEQLAPTAPDVEHRPTPLGQVGQNPAVKVVVVAPRMPRVQPPHAVQE